MLTIVVAPLPQMHWHNCIGYESVGQLSGPCGIWLMVAELIAVSTPDQVGGFED